MPGQAGRPTERTRSSHARCPLLKETVGAGQGLQGLGNVLSEFTLPPADFSHIPLFQPEALTASAVGQVQAFSPPTMAAFKSLTIPAPIQKEVRARSTR